MRKVSSTSCNDFGDSDTIRTSSTLLSVSYCFSIVLTESLLGAQTLHKSCVNIRLGFATANFCDTIGYKDGISCVEITDDDERELQCC